MKSIRLAMLVIFIASLATVVFAQKTGSLQRIKIHGKALEGNLETYEGDHTNRIAERIETKVLPFFSQNLSFSRQEKH